MRQTKSKIWLRAMLIAGCFPVSGVAQDRFIHQPKPAVPTPTAVTPVQLPAPAAIQAEVNSTAAAVPGPQLAEPAPAAVQQTPAAMVPTSVAGAGSQEATIQAPPNPPSAAALGLSLSISGPLEKTQVVERGAKPAVPSARSSTAPLAQFAATTTEQSTSATFRPVNSDATGALAQRPAGGPQSQSTLQWYSRDSKQHVVAQRPHSQMSVVASPEYPSLSGSTPDRTHFEQPQVVEQSQQSRSEMEVRVQHLETKLSEALVEKQNPTVARLVSSRIVNDPQFKVNEADRVAITPIETPTGWQAIGQQLASHMTKCESLLSRGAYYSAREEADTGILILLRQLDLMDNSYRCEPSMAAAKQALREAEDFVAAQRSSSDMELVKRLINAHETPLLKGVSLDGVSPATAAQHYRLFAEKLLVEAALSHPWASELYYAMGRAYQAEADLNEEESQSLRDRALCYYRAARVTLPTNAVACNQLGYLLLQLDRPADAREAIACALSLRGEDAYLSNFAEASRRLGDTAGQQWALQTVANRHANRPPEQRIPQVSELTPTQFAQVSPYASSPNLGARPSVAETAQPAQMYRTATAPVSTNVR